MYWYSYTGIDKDMHVLIWVYMYWCRYTCKDMDIQVLICIYMYWYRSIGTHKHTYVTHAIQC